MTFGVETAIRLLTIATLAGLLFSSGLGLTWREITNSLRQVRLGRVFAANFVIVPALVHVISRLFKISTDTAVGMALLAAAPFAPVVPTFARLAKVDIVVASALTGIFPFFSAFFTPLICEISLRLLVQPGSNTSLKFDVLAVFILLVSTITLPLVGGIVVRHYSLQIAKLLLRPIQVSSEGIGTVALILVTVTEFPSIGAVGWSSFVAMALSSELSFLVGYILSAPGALQRFAVALGTANRNIALAILIAVQSFPDSPIVGTVVANGLLLILFGLVHVGLWRLFVTGKSRRRKIETLLTSRGG